MFLISPTSLFCWIDKFVTLILANFFRDRKKKLLPRVSICCLRLRNCSTSLPIEWGARYFVLFSGQHNFQSSSRWAYNKWSSSQCLSFFDHQKQSRVRSFTSFEERREREKEILFSHKKNFLPSPSWRKAPKAIQHSCRADCWVENSKNVSLMFVLL